MCRKEGEESQRQFVDSGYYVQYGAENELERNYSPQHDAERGPQYGTGEDYSRQRRAVTRRAQYGTVDALNYSPQQGAARWAPSMALEWIACIFQNSMNILSPN